MLVRSIEADEDVVFHEKVSVEAYYLVHKMFPELVSALVASLA